MTNELLKELAPYFTGLASLGALWMALLQRKQYKKTVEAETKAKDAETAINYDKLASTWITRLQDRIKSLEDEIVELKQTIRHYEERMADMYSRLTKGNISHDQ